MRGQRDFLFIYMGVHEIDCKIDKFENHCLADSFLGEEKKTRGDNQYFTCRSLMATGETNCDSSFCDSSFCDSQEKTTMKNDPWTPLPPSSGTLLPMPKNPLYDIISSEEYLESLNRRLHQIRKQGTKEPSAKDILNGLAVKKADIMKQFLDENSSYLNEDDLDSMDAESFQAFLQRKLFPERQAIYAEELVTLIQADELAKTAELQEPERNAEAESKDVQD